MSIITVNFNGASDTLELLDSLEQQAYSNIEVLVVDNASETPIQLTKEYSFPVEVVYSKNNLGFAGGNNLGMAKAKGGLVYLLNNDTLVESDTISQMLEFMQSNTSLGIVSSKIRFTHGDKRIQYAGCTPIYPYSVRGFAFGNQEIDSGQYDRNTITHRPHGASMMIRKEVIRQIGLMPEEYFLYYEEMDYAEMAKRAGWQIGFCGLATVWHKESASTGKNSPLKTYYLTRNRVLFAKRNFKGIQRLGSLLYLLIVVQLKDVLKAILKGDFAFVKTLVKANLWNLK